MTQLLWRGVSYLKDR